MEKKVWFYWSKGFNDCPKIVSIAKKSLQKYASEFEIILLCEKTVWNFINNEINKKTWNLMSEQHRSDFIRISLLEKYGGLWIDATVILLSPLEEIIKDKLIEGFFCLKWDLNDSLLIKNKIHKVGKNRVIASWFFYSDKKNPIVKTLKVEIINYWNTKNADLFIKKTIIKKISRKIYRYLFECRDPWRSSYNTKPIIRKIFGNSYLVINDCFANLILKNNKCRDIWCKIPKISAFKSHQMLQFLSSKSFLEPKNYYPLQKLDYRLIYKDQDIKYLISKIKNN